MRMGSNYQGLIRLFSGINKSKTSSKPFFGAGKSLNQSSGYGRNTLQDLLSGHYKNSYGVEGMCVTGRSDYKKIIVNQLKNKQVRQLKSLFAVLSSVGIGTGLSLSAASRK